MLKKVSRSVWVLGFVLLLTAIPSVVVAQNSRDVEVKKRQEVSQANSQHKKNLTKKQARKQKEKTYAAYFNKLVKDYEGRMEENVVQHRKMAKEHKKPQYSNPTYFGHKKAPKKRKNGKKKLCKECGMWH